MVHVCVCVYAFMDVDGLIVWRCVLVSCGHSICGPAFRSEGIINSKVVVGRDLHQSLACL